MNIEEVKEQITIPEGVTASIDNDVLTIKGEKGEISRVFSYPRIDVSVKDKKVIIGCKLHRKKEKALVGTFTAHINNMIKGVSDGFEYKMKTVFSHFPIKTTVEGNMFVISNFLG